MLEKISKYNYYTQCETMCSLKEALELIDVEKTKVEDLIALEAQVNLYNKYFSGFGNTDE